MLVRFRGGKRGIAEYLRTGKKRGREQTRDELDERVVLSGDLAAVQAAIDAMVGKRERYLHITLSFREDQIPIETLREITRQFRQFALAAYRDDEALFYAEAHLPRIKSLKGEGEGKPIDRLAHIHVVIPKINLLTGGPLNPFGKVARQIPYIDAFQEVINAQYGLASPKDHRRTHFEDRSDVFSRTKGDRFQGSNRELKEKILEHIVAADVKSQHELRNLLQGWGDVRVRNAESDQPYLNLKTPEAAKGVNLKEVFFTPGFLSLSRADKAKLLGEPEGARTYGVPGTARTLDARAMGKVETWFRYRAKEVKYLNSGNKGLWTRYLQMKEEEKMNTIAGREAEFYQKHAATTTLAIMNGARETSQPPEASLIERSDTSLGQRVVDEVNRTLDEVCLSRMSSSQPFSRQKVMADLQKTHGVDGTRFGPALECASSDGTKGLYVFLRTEMHWEPHRSWVYLSRSGLVEPLASQPVSREASEELWAAYQRKKKKIEEDKEQSEARKKAELSALQMSLVLSRKYLWALAQQPSPSQLHPKNQLQDSNFIAGGEGAVAQPYQPERAYKAAEWTHMAQSSGAVDFYRTEKKVCTDHGDRITVDLLDDQALEVILRMAVLKWGPEITIRGDQDFRSKMVAQAARMNVKIKFTDPVLQKELVRLRNQWEH